MLHHEIVEREGSQSELSDDRLGVNSQPNRDSVSTNQVTNIATHADIAAHIATVIAKSLENTASEKTIRTRLAAQTMTKVVNAASNAAEMDEFNRRPFEERRTVKATIVATAISIPNGSVDRQSPINPAVAAHTIAADPSRRTIANPATTAINGTMVGLVEPSSFGSTTCKAANA